MLFDIPCVADRKQIKDYRQSQTDHSKECEKIKHVDYDNKNGDKVLINKKDRILSKSESI